MIAAVVGSRLLRNDPRVREIIDDFIDRYEPTLLVSGGAPGVDTMAEYVARQRRLMIEVIHADWDRLGKGAGYARNGEIANRADHLLAIMIPGGSSGTKDTIDRALRQHKPVTLHTLVPQAVERVRETLISYDE